MLSRKRCHDGRLTEAEEASLGHYIDFLKERAEQLQHLRHHHLQGSSASSTPKALVEQHTTPSTRPSSSSTSSSSSRHRKSRRTKRIFHDRECNHCHTHFTSQWRAGPMGASSLCNACGLRYARRDKHHQPAETIVSTTVNTPPVPASPPQKQKQQPQPGCTTPAPAGRLEPARADRASLSYLLN